VPHLVTWCVSLGTPHQCSRSGLAWLAFGGSVDHISAVGMTSCPSSFCRCVGPTTWLNLFLHINASKSCPRWLEWVIAALSSLPDAASSTLFACHHCFLGCYYPVSLVVNIRLHQVVKIHLQYLGIWCLQECHLHQSPTVFLFFFHDLTHFFSSKPPFLLWNSWTSTGCVW
jgi:hypothetical protein